MWECKYAKEPVDFKLLWLRLRKKIWVLPVIMVIGALIVLGCHYLSRVTANGGRTYETTSVFYLDFATEESGEQYEYINYYTWGELIHSDYFMDSLYDALGGKYSKEELIESVSATIESDVRYLYVRVTRHSADESLEIAKAFEPVITAFSDRQKEFNSISVSDKGDTIRESTKLRVKNACILGAILGLFTALFWVGVTAVLDTRIYIPATLERRYNIPTLGCEGMSEFRINCLKLLKEAQKIAYVSVDDSELIPAIVSDGEIILVTDSLKNQDSIDKIMECDALVIGIKASRGNDKMLERYLDEFSRLGIKVTALMLNEADEKLINAYYKCR